MTGVTIMYMAEGLDTGDMISQVEVPITDEDTSGTLFEKLTAAGAELLMRTLPSLRMNPSKRSRRIMRKLRMRLICHGTMNELIWSRSARSIYNQVRGLCLWPAHLRCGMKKRSRYGAVSRLARQFEGQPQVRGRNWDI